MNFTIVDIETTGLSKYEHKITEIAAAKVRDGEIVETFQSLVNPQVKIPRFITKLTGIDNDMVKDAPTIDKVLPEFVNFIGRDIFVAHNATFDFGFLDHNHLLHHGSSLINERLCTKKLANRLFQDLPRKRLCDLCEHLKIENTQAHRAMSDVNATVEVFTNMLSMMKEEGVDSADKILKFEQSKIVR